MIRFASRRNSAKLLAAAVTAAAVATVAPAQAIVGTPEVVGTTFPLGYTKTPLGIGVTYDARINPAASSIVVTDVNGDPVTGTMTLDAFERTLIFGTTSASRFNETVSPYTAVVTARALNQAGSEPDSVETFTFDVDFITPFSPDVTLNDSEELVTVATPNTELLLEVKGKDIAPDSGNVSGIAKVDVHFYNPLANPTDLTAGGIPEAFSRTVLMPCATDTNLACNATETLDIDISDDLSLGYWNVKVSVTDAAGNRSGESAAVRILKVANDLVGDDDIPQP